MAKSDQISIFHKPNWHPKLQSILGDIKGQYGYVTRFGTIELLGPLWDNPNITSTNYDTQDNGPTLLFSAGSGF